MNLSARILQWFGWRVDISVPDWPKCVICVAPHTSNWDFVLGKLAYWSVGRDAGFLMKDSWFFWPMGCLFRAMGGIPVCRKPGGASLVEQVVEKFNASQRMSVAVTPEGTRSLVTQWRTGFLRIAEQADAHIVLGVIDYKLKRVMIVKTFTPTGDVDADMRAVKDYYRPFTGRHPEKFSAE